MNALLNAHTWCLQTSRNFYRAGSLLLLVTGGILVCHVAGSSDARQLPKKVTRSALLSISSNEVGTKERWAHTSQEGELEFWLSHWDAMVRHDGKQAWRAQYADYFQRNGGFNVQTDFVGLKVMDMGSGPRPLSFVFEGASVSAVEPLGEHFIRECQKRLSHNTLDYLEIQRVEHVYSAPAENLIEEAIGLYDVVLTTNSLDHTWDPTLYLTNARKYLAPQGYVYLIVDLHDKTEPMHPEKSLVTSIMLHVYSAGLRFDRGACTLPPAHPQLAFNSCWFVLTENRDYVFDQ